MDGPIAVYLEEIGESLRERAGEAKQQLDEARAKGTETPEYQFLAGRSLAKK